MFRKRLLLLATAPGCLLFGIAQVICAQSQPQVIDDSQLHAVSTTIGGAGVLSTTRTVQHWFGSTADPHNGVIYGYNMVGANPNSCVSTACSATITTDVIPINVVVEGATFSGEETLAATLASPLFELNDYGWTQNATAAGSFPNAPALIRGAGGSLSQDDAGIPLQLQDAVMRAQFNQTGSSPYHLMLKPITHDAITIEGWEVSGDVLSDEVLWGEVIANTVFLLCSGTL